MRTASNPVAKSFYEGVSTKMRLRHLLRYTIVSLSLIPALILGALVLLSPFIQSDANMAFIVVMNILFFTQYILRQVMRKIITTESKPPYLIISVLAEFFWILGFFTNLNL